MTLGAFDGFCDFDGFDVLDFTGDFDVVGTILPEGLAEGLADGNFVGFFVGFFVGAAVVTLFTNKLNANVTRIVKKLKT